MDGACMPQGRNFSPRIADRCKINLGHNDTGLIACFSQNLAPWVDNDRMAIGFAAIFVESCLRRRNHKRAILNRPRALQHAPMGFARLLRKTGRSRED